MVLCFRPFATDEEERLASSLIAQIDRGEQWIFGGAEGAPEFGGFLDRLFFREGTNYGVFCSCVYNGTLRVQIGFSGDLPEGLELQLTDLIAKARRQTETAAGVWYRPENERLEAFLLRLPWPARGHHTHELTAFPEVLNDPAAVPPGSVMIPFSTRYAEETCFMLDRSMAHTFSDPADAVFARQCQSIGLEWEQKGKAGDCCLLLAGGAVAGFYALKGAEIDLLAVAPERQGRGLGVLLLRHAAAHIRAVSKDNPYLYCIDRNAGALRFYRRQGMTVTGHSGYLRWEEPKA